MRLLAIETSTILGGVALMQDSTLIAESRTCVKVDHSERLMREIDHMLKLARISIDDVDVFAAASGPGSFTGLRVGLSAAKGLAYATGKKLVMIPSLEAFAWNVPFSPYPVCPMFDARKKQVYAALFKWDGRGFENVMKESALSVSELLSGIKEPVIFLGEGAVVYRDIIVSGLGDNALFGAPQHMVPSPANVAHLGMLKAISGDYVSPAGAVPLYMRRSEAEMKHG